MADNENTFLNADNLYEEVEGEAGKNLALEFGQKKILWVSSSQDSTKLKMQETLMRDVGL